MTQTSKARSPRPARRTHKGQISTPTTGDFVSDFARLIGSNAHLHLSGSEVGVILDGLRLLSTTPNQDAPTAGAIAATLRDELLAFYLLMP